jgi:hypothetical protein
MEDRSNMTYRELFTHFCNMSPISASGINDYRQGPVANSIRIWLKNKEEKIATYYPEKNVFTIEDATEVVDYTPKHLIDTTDYSNRARAALDAEIILLKEATELAMATNMTYIEVLQKLTQLLRSGEVIK